MKNKILKILACVFAISVIACLFLPGIQIVEKNTSGGTTTKKTSMYSTAEIISGVFVDENNVKAVEELSKNGTKGEQFAFQMKTYGKTLKISSKKTSVLFAFFLIGACTAAGLLAVGLFLRMLKLPEKLLANLSSMTSFLSIVSLISSAASVVFGFFWVDGIQKGGTFEGAWSQTFQSFPVWGIAIMFILSLVSLILVIEERRQNKIK